MVFVYREPPNQANIHWFSSKSGCSCFIPWLLKVMGVLFLCFSCMAPSLVFCSSNLQLSFFFPSIPVRETSLLEIKEDTDLDPEENSAVFMGVLIKGLAKLKKIPETVKAIQDRLEQELKQIVKRSTTQVADNGYQRGENLSQENQPR